MYVGYQKLLHVSTLRRHHQLVSNANEYRHQYIDMGSTMVSVNVKIVKYTKW